MDRSQKTADERERRLREVTTRYMKGDATETELRKAERDLGLEYRDALIEIGRHQKHK